MGESQEPAQTRRFTVAGLGSNDCVARVEHALLSVPGVENAIVDIELEQAIVRVASNVSNDDLADAVEAAGYALLIAPGAGPDKFFHLQHEPDDPPEPIHPEPPPAPQPPPQVFPGDQDEDSPTRSTWQRVWHIGSRTLIYGFIGSIILTLAYRILPVPTTMLMLSEAIIEGRTIRNNWVALRQISPNLIRAVIASEDNEFCRHWGFDFKELEDAWKESKNGGRLRGASTISQQTAKNVFLWPDRSWIRKGLEAYFTVLIEVLWPKQRIMEVYLNVIEWGPGIFGADAAARRWFGKSAARLTPLEAARLAAILPNPVRYRANPPGPYVNSRGYTISARAYNVDLNGVDRCARP
ncbi:MAG: monofunctional biosynthetic peptidoglycan transglycosylase [Alphaproteobacteria bacterium]|nr:monofunctional biosynthetic peptidoglycan transglycosylase [Alphaproteobacteria bacterium]